MSNRDHSPLFDAAEVVAHAAPIAALLGASIELRDCGTQSALLFVEVDGYCLDPEAAAALILGLIVAKCNHLFSYPSSVVVTTDEGQRCEIKHPTGTNGLEGAFIAACTSFARAHNITPATPKDTP